MPSARRSGPRRRAGRARRSSKGWGYEVRFQGSFRCVGGQPERVGKSVVWRAGLEPAQKPGIGLRVVHASSLWLARERGPDFLGSESRRELPLHDGYGGVLVQQSAPRHQRVALGSRGPVRCCRWPSTGWEHELQGPSLCALVDGVRASAFGSNGEQASNGISTFILRRLTRVIRSLSVRYFSLTTCQAEQDDWQCRQSVRRDLGKALAQGEPEKRIVLVGFAQR